ncbi:DNA cytosine methyltransferase [Corynebacterium aquilae]|uniref:Cytosine-specific methyltransferase n=1 Tax=Corynebacterium aquilae DSM 44791 TaxID=1431546 RepID=A0A1L7CHT6_9CORY|nr:DNA (cytosine-5-)-methyltransferase [Corynebacterium aquilae]APT85333.1 DNA methyltransferase [Corynebacterium aquilae DSM 44791]
MSSPARSFTNIELFAGAGGLALGLEQAGFTSLALVEQDKHAANTLRHNRPEWNVIEADVNEVDFTPFAGHVDLVSGGPPCQSFSYAGKREGFGDTRGTLFSQFARCVQEVQPRMFLFENVRGLLNHDQGRTLATIKHAFEELGYTVQHRVLTASEHGVGQKRQRLIMVGSLENLPFTYPEPDGHITTLREALDGVPDSPFTPYSERKRKVMEQVPPGGCWVDLPDEVAREYMGKSYFNGGGKRGVARRLAWDAPSLTLTTSPSQMMTERCHPEATRPLTVREYARVQAFPDSWEFTGPLGQQYKQIGNAVPVELARRVGFQLINALEDWKKE